MDFKDQIRQLADKIVKIKDTVLTEEATKTAFILPLLSYLGYDVFDPSEVVPEFVADIGIKQGEKIDYAIMRDGKPALLIECKHWKKNLNVFEGQLIRYFQVSRTRFGILTNGIEYRFYSDLDRPNVMDEKPFLSFNITEIKENQIEELKQFHKSYYSLDTILSNAGDLKYTSEIKRIIGEEVISNPNEWFVRQIAKSVYSGTITPKVLERFAELTKRSMSQVINETFAERFQNALHQNDTEQPKSPVSQETAGEAIEKEKHIVTTEEEMEGYCLVKAALRNSVSIDRIFGRDALSYFAVLLDDNNRKPVCRLHFNNYTSKYIETFDEDKKGTRHELESLNDIFKYAETMVKTIKAYDTQKSPQEQSEVLPVNSQ
jgi:hypothetical protein